MKKLLFLVVLMLSLVGCSKNNKVSLEDILTSFYSLESVSESEYIKYNAYIKGNILTVSCESKDYPSSNATIEFIYEDSLLFADIDTDNFMEGTMGQYVAEAVSVLQGNKEGEISKTLNSQESDGYTVKNEGIEVKLVDDKIIKMKIDVNKKIKLLDFSNRYITKQDLEDSIEYIRNGSNQENIGNISLSTSKSSYYGTYRYEILISEEEKLTDNAYKSLLSVLEVMFDDEKIKEYFENNYSSITEGNKKFDGFSVEINSEDEKGILKVTVIGIEMPEM